MSDTTLPPASADQVRGYTPRELAQLLRVSPAKVLTWIRNGELAAVNVASTLCGKPRFVILPDALAAFERRRAGAVPPKPRRRKKRTELIDFYPD